MAQPWERDWSSDGDRPKSGGKPWERQWWEEPGPEEKHKSSGGSAIDWGSQLATGAAKGGMGIIGGAGEFVQAPAANSLAFVMGARALASRGLTAAQNWVAPGSATADEDTQRDAQLASRFAAEQRAANADIEGGSWLNPRTMVARLGLGLREATRSGTDAVEDFERRTNPELIRQQGEVAAADGFVPTVKAMAQNPMATTHMLARSAPDMILGLGLARAAAAHKLAGAGAAAEVAGAKAAAAGLSAEAQAAAAKAAIDATAKQAVARASTVGALAEGASSANSAREGVYREVMAMPTTKLAESPRFREIMAETGGDAVRAQQVLANELADQAPLLAAAGTLTGSALARRIFGGDTTARVVAGQRIGVRDVGRNILEEGTEEGLQGVPEDLVQHGAVVQADPSKQFDLGGTLAQNVVAGALMGGGGTGARAVQQGVQDLRRPGGAAGGAAASPPGGAIDAAEVLGQPGGAADASISEGGGRGAGRTGGAPAAAVAAQTRLAELDLLGQQRDLSPAERGEVSRLEAELDRAEAGGAAPGAADASIPEGAGAGPQWQAFTPETGTLGVPRAEMPQIEAQHRGALVQFLGGKGIQHEQVELDGKALKSTQAEFDRTKVAAMAADPGASSRSVLVSSDGYVLDGHHQWLAAVEAGKPVKAIRLEAPIRELLTVVPQFPSAGQAQGAPGVSAPATAETSIFAPGGMTALERVDEIDGQLAARPADSPEAAALRAQRDEITATWPKAVRGAETTFSTEAGARLGAQYAVVDIGDLVTSHDAYLRPNPAYPQELQPRDRSRAASSQQIAGIVTKIDPARLGLSADAATGAPIIGADGLVESGNARSIALQRIYRAKGQKAEDYKAWLQQNAQQFGLSAADVAGLQEPVLVRIRTTPVNRAEFARQANASPVAPMSPVELAAQDAGYVDASVLEVLEEGDVGAASNRDFVRAFVGKVRQAGQDVSGLMTADGRLSPTGRLRIQAALMQAAYSDGGLVQEMFDSLDTDIRSIGEALKVVAGDWAGMREAAAAGRIAPDADITGNLLQAVDLARRARRERRSVAELVRQPDLETGEVPDALTVGLLHAFYRGTDFARAAGREHAVGVLRDYVRGAMATTAGADLLGDVVTPAQVLQSITTTEGARDAQAKAPESGPEPQQQRDPRRGPDEAREGEAGRPDAADGRRAGNDGGAGDQDATGPVGGRSGQAEAAGTALSEADQAGAEPAPAPAAPAPTLPGAATAARSIEDAGEKIGGARKDRWAERGLDVADLDAMAEGEGAELATKANVWKPDYQAIAAQAEPVTAAMVKVVYDSLAAKPRQNTPQGRRDYVRAMQAVRKAYGGVRSVEEAKDAYRQLRAELGVQPSAGLRALDPASPAAQARRVLFSVYKGRGDPFVFGYNELARAKKLVQGGFPGAVEPWTRRFVIRELAGAGVTERGVELLQRESAAAGAPLTADQVRAGHFEVRDKAGKALAFLPTRADAEQAAKALYEAATAKGDDKAEPSRPHLDAIVRAGLAEVIDRDVTPQDLLDTFGFRGVEWGNWSAQDERQRILNLAHDALADLAGILNVPRKALSLNGTLGMAFGARGSGRALAHYEPGKLVINMTKLRGAGSLAHEWAHALDHYLGELDRVDAYQGTARGATGWRDLRSYTGRDAPKNLRPELAGAVDAVMRRLYEGTVTRVQMLELLQAQLERTKSLGASEQDPATKKAYTDSLAQQQRRIDEVQAAPAATTYPRGKSDFSKEAQKLSGKSSSGYWLRPTEMWARAFEAYVFDRLVAMGARSEYLVHGVEQDRFDDPARFKGNPYPKGAERAAINAAFDGFVAELRTRSGRDGAVALFSRRGRGTDAAEVTALRALSDTDELFALPKPRGTTVEAVAAEIDPGIRVRGMASSGGRTDYTLTLPEGNTARLVVREPNPYGPQVYGYDLVDGEMTDPVTERPGDNPEDVGPKGDVWIDASLLSSGAGGGRLYAIAAAYAHNTGRVFIGDPAGLSDEALRRRPEQMLSSALKYGTTEHLAPHPRQISGDAKLGVPPLRWAYGDDLGNIRRLLEVTVASLDNAGLDEITFDPSTGRFADSAGQEVGRDGIGAWVEAGYGRGANAGGRTLARSAVFRALLREEGRGGQGGGRRDGLLARLAELAGNSPAIRGILYSRSDRAGAAVAGPAGGIDVRGLLGVVHRVTRALPGLPKVNVMVSPESAPEGLQRQIRAAGAWNDVEGAFFEGEIYLFASGIADEARAEHVLADHEAAHVGLAGMLGESRPTVLRAIWFNNTAIRKAAHQLQQAEPGLSEVDATEEVLVDMPSEDLVKLTDWRKLVGKVRDWLAGHGFSKLAAQIDEWLAGSLTEQQRADLVAADLVRAARAFVAQPGAARPAAAAGSVGPVASAAAFSRPRGGQQAPAGDAGPWAAVKAKLAAITDPAFTDRLIYEFQDKLVDLKRLREHIRSAGGTITDLNDAYLGEELYHKRLAKRTEDFLKGELRPLLADLHARGETIEGFERYLHARHAPEANAALAERNPNRATIDALRGQAKATVARLEQQLESSRRSGAAVKAIEGALAQARAELSRLATSQAFHGTEAQRLSLSGMTNEDAAALMAGLTPAQRANYEALAARVDAINAKTLQALEQYGLMSPSTLQEWRRGYQFYVPLHRDEAHVDSGHHPVGQGFSVKGDASRRRVGSNEQVTHILGHIAAQREAALTRGEKNLVVKKLYLMAAQNPDAEFWHVDTPPKVSTVDPTTGFVRTGIDPTYKHRPNVLMLRVAGRDAAIIFNEKNRSAMRLAEAMKNLDVSDLHVVLSIAAKGTRWFASVNTQYNPIFGLINFARDLQAGLLNLSTTPLAGKQREVASHVLRAMRAIYRNQRGKSTTDAQWARLWQEMQDAGGTTGYRDLFTDASDRSKALERELRALDRGKVSQAAHAVVDWLSDYNETMENSVRLAAYKVALDQGMTKERAASLAKNVTVNFNRKGRQAREIGALYAFFNASLQGTARMWETLSGPLGKKVMFGGIALGVLNTLLGMAVMGGGDDDEPDAWEQIPEFVKERSLVIPIGRRDFVSIPMPLGFHVFPNIGRLATEFAFGDSRKTAGRQLGKLLTTLADAFNPLGGSQNLGQLVAPTVIDPVVALMENRDWTGRPIYREDRNPMDPQPGHALAKDSASTPSRALAVVINRITGGTEYRPGAWSPTPDQLDYIVGQLTGGLGRELLKLNQTVTAPFTGDELPPHKVPLLGRLYGNTRGAAGQSGEFYENVKLLNELENEVKGRERNNQDAEGFMASEPLTGLIGTGNAAERDVRELRAARRSIVEQAEPGHREQLREIDEQIGEIMKQLNAEVSRVRRRGAIE